MRVRIAVLLTFAVLIGCSDQGMVQPEQELPTLAAIPDNSQFAKMNGGMEFNTRMLFAGPLNAGEAWSTPGGIMHVIGAANLFQFEEGGFFEGTWTFSGKWHLNTKTGKGKSINVDGNMVLTGPGEGTFDCTATGIIENYLPPDYAFLQYGSLTGCHGTGDFEGMHMKGRFSNEANPGIGDYDFWGVLW